jgi:hypothetical protein
MKYILTILAVIIFQNITIAQDKIKTKEGTNLNVKIIYIDNNDIYFYQTSDPQKTIRKVNKKYVSAYEYISIDNGKNKEVVSSDSTMFVNYQREIKGVNEITNLKYKNISTYSNDSLISKNVNITILDLPRVNQKFMTAGNKLIAASIFFIGGSALNLYVINREPDLSSSIDDLLNFYKTNKNLTNISYSLYGVSGLFVLSAGINIHNGALLLK